MWGQNKLNIFKFLVFVSLIHWIRGELKDFKEKTTGTVSENIDGMTVITLMTSVDENLNKKNTSYELSVNEIKAAEPEDKFTRRTRDSEPILLYSKHFDTRVITTTTTTRSLYLTSTLDCYYCSASSTSGIHDPCYEGGR